MPPQRTVWTDKKIAELKRLRASGKTFKQCADEMGLPYVQIAHTVYRKYVLKATPEYFGPRIDLVGQKFGRLTVISKIKNPRYKQGAWVVWRCLCECGKKKSMASHMLVTLRMKSCGCIRKTHGMTHTPTFTSWQSMLSRCRDKENTSYGGREIDGHPAPVTVCERWQGKHGFENFLADLGPRSKGLTLERQDPHGNYEPGNCAWANKCHQELNKRRDVTETELEDAMKEVTGDMGF
jgi:hypothetical protein